MKGKQIAVIAAVVVIIGYLYLRPVKGLIKPKEAKANNGMVAGSAKPVVAVTADMVSVTAKTAIGANLSAKITDLEEQLKQASGDKQKADLQRQLAKQWDDVNQPAPAAFYYLELGRKQNNFDDWLNAGNRFNDAYKASQDSTLQAALVTNAVEAFENATKLKPDNLDAKAGLGIADVNGGAPSPMTGIGLLLDVVAKDPANRNANFNLGLFAIKSGQFDKAVARFKTILAQKPEVESYFYIAESYKQLGQKKEAIEAYQKCKELMQDPIAGKRIDDFIKELKN
ncbi:MAG: tetratricopeptide repeat protein [Bacteroidota bacterium]